MSVQFLPGHGFCMVEEMENGTLFTAFTAQSIGEQPRTAWVVAEQGEVEIPIE